MVSWKTRLIDKHAGVEVRWWRRAHVCWPLHLFRALLAVSDLKLRRVTPCVLTKAIHHGVEVAVGHVKQVINVIKHLYIAIQVNQLLILHKLKNKEPNEHMVCTCCTIEISYDFPKHKQFYVDLVFISFSI